MKYIPAWKWSWRWCGVGAIMASLLAINCMEAQQGVSPDEVDEYWGEPWYSEASDPIEFTRDSYDFSGDTQIAELRELIQESTDEPWQPIWYGFSEDDPYPVDGDCDPERIGDADLDDDDPEIDETIPEYFEELPATIEGVVTLHPRYFENVTVCRARERYQGTFVIQDESAGIHVLRDSRVADFDVGDRVRMRVRSLVRNFGTRAVLGFDEVEVLTDYDDREAIYYEPIDRPFDTSNNSYGVDNYEVRRICGEVTQEATNQNFNEMTIESTQDPSVEWTASLDRELGTRGVGPKLGDVVELTGPVVDSFDLRMLIASLGQMKWVDECEEIDE